MKAINVALAVLVILFAASSTVGATLVANGGFDTGDFSGWTQSGNPEFTHISNAPDIAHSGTYGVLIGPEFDPGYITQDIATTFGQSYTVDFWLRDMLGVGEIRSFTALWNGVDQITLTNPALNPDWVHYSYTAVAAAGTTSISFGFRHDPFGWAFDDVTVNPASVVPVPGAIWLFGSGLAGLAGIGRWRRRK